MTAITPPMTGVLCLAAPVNVAIGAEVVGFTVETGGAGGTDVVGAGCGGTTLVLIHCDHELAGGAGGAGGTTDVLVIEGVEGLGASLHCDQVTGGAGGGEGVVLPAGVLELGGGGGGDTVVCVHGFH